MSFIKNFLSFFIGKWAWSPPPWLKLIFLAIASLLAFFWCRLKTWRAKSPKKFTWSLSGLVFLIVAGGFGYAWYQSLPKPAYLTWSASTIRATSFDADAKPEPLTVSFSGSAAALELVGKDAGKFVTLEPNLDGEWRWKSDSELVFVPKEDWPVGQKETIKLDKKTLGSHVRLESYTLDFSTPAFNVSVDEIKFYEDPTDPKKKEVVATLSFSHPVDKTSLTKGIKLKMRIEPDKSFDDSEAKVLDFTADFSEKGDKAFIHSSTIGIPKRDGEVQLKGTDIASSRGGPPISSQVTKTVYIPGVENYFKITDAQASVVTRSDNQMERVVVIESSANMKQEDLAKYAEVYLLPKDLPQSEDNPEGIEDYEWESGEDVTKEILKISKQLNVAWTPSERPYMPLQSFSFEAPEGRYLYVRVKKGLTSFGDYPLVKDWSQVVQVEEFPETVKILHEGSILSLSGSKQLSVLVRNVPGIKIEAGRLLPKAVHHLVSLNYDTMQNPSLFDASFGIDQLTEVITKEERIPQGAPGKAQYTSINFGDMLSQRGTPRGLFLLKVSGYDLDKKELLESADTRLILVTDMGVIVKQAPKGDQELYVQSIVHGSSVEAATVSILGANGLPLFTQTTDSEGVVRFPALKDFKRDKLPTVYVVERGDDLTFLPYQRYDRKENLSRYDIGGLYETSEYEALQAYLFSSRGIYRPGDQVELGLLLKKITWEALPDGLPVELVISDPSGTELRHETIKFGKEGIAHYVFPTEMTSLTGTYQVELYIMKDKQRNSLLGSTTFKVEEFQPDRMKIKATLDPDPVSGWLHTDDVKAQVLLTNLYGTAATKKKIKAKLDLIPSALNFSEFPSFSFVDPFTIKDAKSFSEDLGEFETDAEGKAEVALRLDRFEKTSYTLHVTAQGFESEGGRFVATDIFSKVSPAPYLVGSKADGDLSYIQLNTARNISLIAINPDLQKIDLSALDSELVRIVSVSTLVKKDDGTFAYQAIKKEEGVAKEKLDISSKGSDLKLKTDSPGNYLLRINDSKGNELQKISYYVAGESNVAASRTRDAELNIRLSKKEFSTREDIEVQIDAPYTGSGLITIERDKVYAHKWFRADAKSSRQTITVPEGLEGNAYIHVAFTRSLNSEDIYTNPFSYAVVPFNLNRGSRTLPLKLAVPAEIIPGETLKISYSADPGSKIILFGVDEGILQVARYKTPDPLSHFMRKRALLVDTYQILDLLLPEYELAKKLSGPGGDEDALLKKNLNPFRRKSEKPVVFWSGVLTVPENGMGEYEYKVPFYFNGTIKVMAVGVSDEKISATTANVISQGHFVLQPQVPAAVAPGDEFLTVVTVAAPKAASAMKADVTLKLDSGAEIVGDLVQSIEIPKGGDIPVTFRIRAKNKLGAASISFIAKDKDHEAAYPLEYSIRPASLHFTTVDRKVVKTGVLQSGVSEIPVSRSLYPEHRKVELTASVSPVSFLKGISEYLEEYPHGCAEQVTSKAFPALVLGTNKEFGLDSGKVQEAISATVRILQSRQRPDGSFSYWPNSSAKEPFVDMYVLQFLTEAKERGREVPKHMLSSALSQAKDTSLRTPQNIGDARIVAYAIYLLARNGKVPTNELTNLREILDKSYAPQWKNDILGLWLAGTYKILKLDKDAEQIRSGYDFSRLTSANDYEFIDANVMKGVMLSIYAKHFPEALATMNADKIADWCENIANDGITTIGGAFATLGLDAYGKAGAVEAGTFSLQGVKSDNSVEEIVMNGDFIKSSLVSPDFKSLKLQSSKDKPLFLQLVQTGFDIPPLPEPKKDRIEIFREFQNEKGEPVTTVSVDEPVFGVIQFRTLDKVYRRIVIVDLLPGGLELDLEKRENLASGNTADWYPDSVDMREDRLILYGSVGETSFQYKYKLKPTAQGTFIVPPIYAEGMYDLKARTWSGSGKITVTK